MSYTQLGISNVRHSRKRRQCIWCGEFIEVGEPYTLNVNKFEGFFNRDVYHPECYDACGRAYAERILLDSDGFYAFSWDRGSTEERGTAARRAESEASHA